MKYAINLTLDARQAIQNQVDWIAVKNQSPENAARWAERLLKAIDKLDVLPARSAIDQGQSRIHSVAVYRLVFERTYLVFYTIDEDLGQINVVAFGHGARKRK